MQTTDLQWSTTKLRINDLIPFEGNPRQMTDAQAVQLKASLEKFNLVEIPAVNTNGKILAGHQRLKIMQILGRGQELVDCRIPNRMLTPEEEREYLLRSNKNTGEWDFDALANFDEELLKTIGFSSKELDRIFDLKGGDEDDVPDVPATARAERGKVYQLGEHRVMCGDSTNAGDVALLMDGKKADMVFTSPPYNVGNNSLGGNKNLKGRKYLNDNDDKPQSDYFEFLRLFLSTYQQFSQYQFINIQSLAGNKIAIIDLLHEFKSHFVDVSVWCKGGGQPAMAESVLNSRFEFIYIFSSELNPTRQIKTNKFRNISNVFELNPSGKNEWHKIHAATFPVEFAEHFISIGSSRDGVVAEPFCGVGSTLIACEKNSRICYGMEIDPHYVDVIIERWCTFTGNDREAVYARAQQPEKQP